jgi:hypothetical protein
VARAGLVSKVCVEPVGLGWLRDGLLKAQSILNTVPEPLAPPNECSTLITLFGLNEG